MRRSAWAEFRPAGLRLVNRGAVRASSHRPGSGRGSRGRGSCSPGTSERRSSRPGEPHQWRSHVASTPGPPAATVSVGRGFRAARRQDEVVRRHWEVLGRCSDPPVRGRWSRRPSHKEIRALGIARNGARRSVPSGEARPTSLDRPAASVGDSCEWCVRFSCSRSLNITHPLTRSSQQRSRDIERRSAGPHTRHRGQASTTAPPRRCPEDACPSGEGVRRPILPAKDSSSCRAIRRCRPS